MRLCNCKEGESSPDVDGYCENCGLLCKPKLNKVLKDNSRNHFEISATPNLALVSSIGLNHCENQDYGNVLIKDENIVMVVSDGVSATEDASYASTTAVNTVCGLLLEYTPDTDPKEVMRNAIETANIEIQKKHSTEGFSISAECTVVAALVVNNTVTIGWVGDSRAYMICDKDIKLTIDDSWLEETVSAGKMSYKEALENKFVHCITQSLGTSNQDVDIHIIQTEIEKGQLLLLCSDGLWNCFENDNSFIDHVNEYNLEDLLILCNSFVDKAKLLGSNDDITVAIYKY
ncbi:PP2C family protein-serine/threonine phosphatase [Acetivibrio cellulolyticus]|uniref:PP2C family protein-serine/threonine phosphatase n=1 Tax=Acetivibrio cellulolyticus TaxID=35830 RepID=UPI0001E2DF0B|nr:protein phosphatase 2C domain-containing protein [Acetivibrio cellulolyticus]